MKRPVGVTIIAVLLIIGAVIGIVAGLAGLGVFGASAVGAVAVVTLVLGVVQLIVALGLWGLQKWAWTFAVIVVLLRIAGDIWSIFADVQLATIAGSLIINLLIFFYLWSQGVRSAFS